MMQEGHRAFLEHPVAFPAVRSEFVDDVLVKRGHLCGVRGVGRSNHVPPSPVNRNLTCPRSHVHAQASISRNARSPNSCASWPASEGVMDWRGTASLGSAGLEIGCV